MKTIPYIEDDFAKASEYLRLVIAFLSKQAVPPSPLNYRVGYDYVTGRNKKLETAINGLLESEGDVSTESLWEAYQQFFVQDDKALESIRQELRQLITSIQGEFRRSGGDLSSYVTRLSQFSTILNDAISPEAMSAEVQKVIDDTRTMEQSQQEMESQMSNVLSEVESLRKELEQVKQESLTDALTGLANRRAFDTAIEQHSYSAQKNPSPSPFTLMLIDIDHFKQFNDTYGHLVGDKVLRFLSTTLKHCLTGKDIAARYGGEEFAVILPQTPLSGADTVAEQIRNSISSIELKDRVNGESYGNVSVSIGIAQYRLNEMPDELIQRVDQALYRAKEQGRNRVEKAA
ncbi:MAG: GGDEF domain-containing protein [Candidatus Thiodiazotropha lotti]|nr:GGDEF domain-containing protein [Candidatus Thiodiazotropha lotti]MCW4217148.1 GGDEF domain-containing protein [Candidatus Thiodiazotropha lotti]